MIEPIDLPIAPKDVFRILALRSIVEQPAMIQKLLDSFDSILEGIPTTPRLDPTKFTREPFDYEHTDRKIVNSGFGEFTERELCSSADAFFGNTFAGIGKVIDYELPLDITKGSALGKVDLVSLLGESTLFLLEVKKVESNEHPLRAMFEIFTFWKMLSDGDGSFTTFIERYKNSKQFKEQVPSVGDEIKVVPGLLLCRGSDILERLQKPKEHERELYKKFLDAGLHVFSYHPKAEDGSRKAGLKVEEITRKRLGID